MIKIRSVYLVGVDVWQIKDAKVPFAVKKIDRERDKTAGRRLLSPPLAFDFS